MIGCWQAVRRVEGHPGRPLHHNRRHWDAGATVLLACPTGKRARWRGQKSDYQSMAASLVDQGDHYYWMLMTS